MLRLVSCLRSLKVSLGSIWDRHFKLLSELNFMWKKIVGLFAHTYSELFFVFLEIQIKRSIWLHCFGKLLIDYFNVLLSVFFLFWSFSVHFRTPWMSLPIRTWLHILILVLLICPRFQTVNSFFPMSEEELDLTVFNIGNCCIINAVSFVVHTFL